MRKWTVPRQKKTHTFKTAICLSQTRTRSDGDRPNKATRRRSANSIYSVGFPQRLTKASDVQCAPGEGIEHNHGDATSAFHPPGPMMLAQGFFRGPKLRRIKDTRRVTIAD